MLLKLTRNLKLALILLFSCCSAVRCLSQDGPTDKSLNERIELFHKQMEKQQWPEALETLKTLNDRDYPAFNIQHARLRILRGEYDEAARIVESFADANSDTWTLTHLGLWCIERSPSKSRKYLTRSLEIEPTLEASQCAINLAILQNDTRFAANALRKLFKRHPVFMGGYSLDLGLPIENEDRRFGENQVECVCRDRPELASLINSRLSVWLATRFAGAFIGKRAVWTPTKPEGLKIDVLGCHLPATATSDAAIWVNAELDAEIQLATLIFELLNAENSSEGSILTEKAMRGSISKESYVREIAKLEHRALLKRRAFFAVEYSAGGLPENSSIKPWLLHVPNDFDVYFRDLSPITNDHYAAYYDSLQKQTQR